MIKFGISFNWLRGIDYTVYYCMFHGFSSQLHQRFSNHYPSFIAYSLLLTKENEVQSQ